MQKMKIGMAVAALAMGFATTAAMAQSGNDEMMMRKRMVVKHGSAHRASAGMRPLTVAKPMAPAPGLGLSAPITAAGQIAVAPLSGLSQAFGYGPIGGPAKPLPIVARYAGAGAVTDSINQGWAQPVPVSANGPVYKLEAVSNAGGVSPFAIIAAPITAATTLAATPLNAAGALVGAAPAPAPVF